MNPCECHDIWANYKHGECPRGGDHDWHWIVKGGKMIYVCAKCGKPR